MRWPWSRREASNGDAPALAASPDHAKVVALQGLQQGGVVLWGDYELTVLGRLDLMEDGSRWTELIVADGQGTRCWVGVESDAASPVTFWYELPGGQLESGSVGDPELGVGGVTYRLDERGTASFTAVGSTGTAASGSADWVDYHADGGQLLGCERFGDEWEVHLGQVVPPSELTIRPGAGA
ncbi:DUF4178 domain-containing protein [Janibacter anophelis]|uniref:DUF4178 domain-containing protein n=1 Tax=Janibacter anophelis TaxID=319054 RepID=UPI000ADCCFB9|nr:DUF4178 domain-containing protein [Janibacter anophelis]